MKLEFAYNEISAYAVGNDVYQNEGKAIEVHPGAASAFLAAKAKVGGKMVNIFKPAQSEINAASKESEEQPETAVSLSKAHSREDLVEMAKQYGLDGDGYTNKQELATAILAAKTDR